MFGRHAVVSFTPSQDKDLMKNLNRTSSGQYLVSPVNSDLAGLPGTEDLVVNLMVQQIQPVQITPRPNQQQESYHAVQKQTRAMSLTKRKMSNKDIAVQPSAQSMNAGIRRLEKNLQKKIVGGGKTVETSSACQPMSPDSIIDGIILKRRIPSQTAH